MNKVEYKEKLQHFNSTPKYKSEQDFLIRLLNPQRGEKILDYGTGLGRMVYHLNMLHHTQCFGYDQHNLREKDDEYLFRQSFQFKFQKVFFMHSLAHIPEVEEKLAYLRDNFLETESSVYVITPNKNWLTFFQNVKGYIADPSVINHFTSETLRELFTSTGFEIIQEGQFGAIQQNQHERLFLEAKKGK